MGLLTYPITLAPAAQMLEHHLRVHYDHFSACHRCRSNGAGVGGSGGGGSDISYQRIASPISSPEKRATSKTIAAYSALGADPAGSICELSFGTGEATALDLPTDFGAQHTHPSADESSMFLRCTNRLALVCATTFVAAYIPCFGMVSPSTRNNRLCFIKT